MSLAGKTLFLCDCNQSMPLDADALAQALQLDAPPVIHTLLCQRELAAFADGATGDVIAACTQEQRLLGDVADEDEKVQTIRFVNIRETGGWSSESRAATPKIAALLALAAMPDPPPVPSVDYVSAGQVLIVGPLDRALRFAGILHGRLGVTVLATATGSAGDAPLPMQRDYPVFSGTLTKLTGWLGAFDATWTQDNPIDLDLCTRCNACLRACPEDAITAAYQVDLDKCRSHRACVVACGDVKAIDFARADRARTERFDVVLDVRGVRAFTQHQLPQGYFAPAADTVAEMAAVMELATLSGDFEKPKFFQYKASICAHSRSKKTGCTQCIDVCSAAAIRADGDRIAVEPHLCVGCGACTTVCPSGALTYAYPTVPELGERIRTVLSTYARAGGRDACLLLHAEDSRDAIATLARQGNGLPARVIPLEIQHVASTGLDVWLAALAWGAVEVDVLTTGNEAPQYHAALAFQMQVADTIATALGYQGTHFRTLDAAALPTAWSTAIPLGARAPARFAPTPDKRTTAMLAIEHLALHAPAPQTVIALPAGAPFGTIAINKDTCTMCLACVGACPEAAILDNIEAPQVRFVESKCVQCGICASTCPEHAITLQPRLSLLPEAKAPRLLNEAKLFACIKCGKPVGTEKMIETMLGKLSGHSMFAGPGALDRLKMCADCRVVDLITNENSVDIRDL